MIPGEGGLFHAPLKAVYSPYNGGSLFFERGRQLPRLPVTFVAAEPGMA